MFHTRTVLLLVAIATVAIGELDENFSNIEDVLDNHGLQYENDIINMLDMDSKNLDPEIVLDSFLLTVIALKAPTNTNYNILFSSL